MSGKLNTLLEILNYSADLLSKKGVNDPRLNVELMFAHVLSCSRLDLYLNFDKPLNVNETGAFKLLLKRRLAGEPLQYILGSTNFYGYDIRLSPDVLIPRPDTEVLVEKFLESLSGKDNFGILEVGTGSGCIAVAVIKELEKSGRNFNYTGIDVSDKAIEITISNLINNKANSGHYIIKNKDFLSGKFSIDELEIETRTRFDFIISNPPYISNDEFAELDEEVRGFEPMKALTDGGDGLAFYRKLLEIKNDRAMWLEISYNRKEVLTSMLGHANITGFEFFKDYGGNYRVLRID